MLDGPTELQVRMHVPPWMRRSRARQIAGTLANATPDLIHAIGEQAWTVGLDLARVIDRPVTLDVWSADLLKRVPPGRAAARVAAYIAATEPLADALRDRVEPGLVSVVPMGVRMPRSLERSWPTRRRRCAWRSLEAVETFPVIGPC